MNRPLISLAAGSLAVLMLSSCGAAPQSTAVAVQEPPAVQTQPPAEPTPAPEPWEVQPAYTFDEMVPLYSRDTHTAGHGVARGIYAVRQGDKWSLFRQDTGTVLLENAALDMPYLYGDSELVFWPDVENANDYAAVKPLENTCNEELNQQRLPFEARLGDHGGYASYWIWTDGGQVYRDYLGGYEFNGTPVEKAYAPELAGVRQATWNSAWAVYEVSDGAPYAVMDQNGQLLTDFQYQDACMAGEQLIAVQDDSGLWGYCDRTGALVIPCQYQGQMSLTEMGEPLEYPMPEMDGLVVVKDQQGDKLVLAADGSEVLAAGQYEDIAPARDGCIWAKKDGQWGLLRLRENSAAPALSLPEGFVQPDVTFFRVDSPRYYTQAEHGLSMRQGPGTEFEKVGSIPCWSFVTLCGTSAEVPGWALVSYEGSFGWVSMEYLQA